VQTTSTMTYKPLFLDRVDDNVTVSRVSRDTAMIRYRQRPQRTKSNSFTQSLAHALGATVELTVTFQIVDRSEQMQYGRLKTGNSTFNQKRSN